jgi:hypothetical protein
MVGQLCSTIIRPGLPQETSGGSLSAHTNNDVGWLAGASAGYEWPLGLASEFKLTFRQNHLDRVATSTPLFLGGDMHSFAMILNGYYRFHNAPLFTPYIGGGLGEAVVSLNNTRPNIGFDAGPFGGTDATSHIRVLRVLISNRASSESRGRISLLCDSAPGFQEQIAGDEVKVSPTYNSHNAVLHLVYNF